MSSVLYISYDGLTDPLGQSQILPYLTGLARHGYRFTLVSLEKPAALEEHGEAIVALTKAGNIEWIPVTYNTQKGMGAKLANDRSLKREVENVLHRNNIQLIHSRSYPASVIAMRAAKHYNIKFVFDMRGFWADERVEGRIWDRKKPHHRILYRYFKKKEKQLLEKSAHVVSLTQAAKDHMVKHFPRLVNKEKITVIPCCADLKHFSPHAKNLSGKKTLGIQENDPVLIYLGSVGTWYMLDEMVSFFRSFSEKYPGAVFLVVTQNQHDLVHAAFRQQGISETFYRVVSAGRNEVPAYIACADAAVFFVRPSFSKTASSPVKLAELMGCGLPVFANAGIGDMDLHAQQTDELFLIGEMTEKNYTESIGRFQKHLHSPEKARAFAMEHYSLEAGVNQYLEVYKKVLNR